MADPDFTPIILIGKIFPVFRLLFQPIAWKAAGVCGIPETIRSGSVYRSYTIYAKNFANQRIIAKIAKSCIDRKDFVTYTFT